MLEGLNLNKNLVRYASEKSRVIAGNLANINNPNYKRRYMNDLSEEVLGFQEMVQRELKVTDEKHLQLKKSSVFDIKTERTQGRNDGNNVVLDKEIIDASENQLLYKTSVSLLNSQLGMLRTAITGESR